MERELAAEIERLGLAQAYFQFTVAIEQQPLNPRGWFGLALVAEASGDTRAGTAYRQRVAALSGAPPPTLYVAPREPEPIEEEYEEFEEEPYAAREVVWVPTGVTASQREGFVPVKVPDTVNIWPWARIGCPLLLACSCCLWLGLRGPSYQSPPPPSASFIPSTKRTSQPTTAPQPDMLWHTVHLTQAGNVSLDIPPGFDPSYTYQHQPGFEHFDFQSRINRESIITVDIVPKRLATDPFQNANNLNKALAKSYKGDYNLKSITRVSNGVVWEFLLIEDRVATRRSDGFKTLNSGRLSAVMVKAPPTFFEGLRGTLGRLQGSITEQ